MFAGNSGDNASNYQKHFPATLHQRSRKNMQWYFRKLPRCRGQVFTRVIKALHYKIMQHIEKNNSLISGNPAN